MSSLGYFAVWEGFHIGVRDPDSAVGKDPRRTLSERECE
jgi:hypothetical protein